MLSRYNPSKALVGLNNGGKSMNASQIKYLFQQLDGIGRDLCRKIDKTYPDTFPTFAEKYELIRAGKVNLLPFKELNKYTNLVDAFDFSSTGIDNKELREQKYKTLAERIQSLKNTVVFDGASEVHDLLKQIRELDVSGL